MYVCMYACFLYSAERNFTNPVRASACDCVANIGNDVFRQILFDSCALKMFIIIIIFITCEMMNV
jgi:hypothetical protein